MIRIAQGLICEGDTDQAIVFDALRALARV
jgi:hypothetical protein